MLPCFISGIELTEQELGQPFECLRKTRDRGAEGGKCGLDEAEDGIDYGLEDSEDGAEDCCEGAKDGGDEVSDGVDEGRHFGWLGVAGIH